MYVLIATPSHPYTQGWTDCCSSHTDTCYVSLSLSHTLEFSRGTLNSPNVISMMEYRNATAALEEVMDRAAPDELLNAPPNLNSPYVSVFPHDRFADSTGMGEISIMLDPSVSHSGVAMFRANPNTDYVFTQLPTQIIDGRAVAQTNEGGIFVAGSGVNYSLVVGVVVAGVVLLLVAIVVVGTIVYFVARPEKWQSAKNNLRKTQMKVKRSLARKV